MGLIKIAMGAIGNTFKDQYKEYFYCDALPENVLVRKGQKKNPKGNNHGNDNVISNGSTVTVADGQCLLIVENGKIIDVCAEPGEFKYDSNLSPSVFEGGLQLGAAFKEIGNQIAHAGVISKDQRVYYVNTRELMGNKFGTQNPVPFRVVDQKINLDIDIAIRCNGQYSYRISNPLLFYVNVCGNVTKDFTRDQIDSQLKSEFLTALQPAFGRLSEMGIRYSSITTHTMEMAKSMNDILSADWSEKRGIEIVSVGINSLTASEEDEKLIKELQKTAALTNANMAAAHMVSAQAAAMQAAASNSAGAPIGFMGMNMAAQAGGMNVNDLFAAGAAQQAAAQQQAAAPKAGAWICPNCGTESTGKFCTECGTKKPEASKWFCPECGTANTGKFCIECGTKKPN